MAVQQHVLNWLYSVLTSEYQDVNRTYNDVAQALSQFPSLSPRTDVHTFSNGASALLLHLSGTLPAVFRGTTYRYPISVWVPHAYPREAPLVYVTPTENMMVRPGQHVDPQGQVYHPYLVGWSEFWDKSSIVDFLAILRDVFAKEPPVIARQSVRPSPSTAATPSPPPIPPFPQELAAHHSAAAFQLPTPPPKPSANVTTTTSTTPPKPAPRRLRLRFHPIRMLTPPLLPTPLRECCTMPVSAILALPSRLPTRRLLPLPHDHHLCPAGPHISSLL
ncbi:endosomal sorting complex protein [Grosmannia clavigera kw1407]|uniref:Endosomal sorting complex protein n=1 Tax=Grosmannia clavigera (strain kw1407 / UAMH 11150) TaxID=655863 RepID=F0XDK4_GROCL|nr:endosomal sorting complex protein [Grosmannia clavigera kw1407]EFX04575.1 endosomal sorting complex protein [Grosmannia clavigera kw1407]